jgi:hypothetical protein
MLAKRRAEKARLEFLDKVVRRQTKLFCPLPSTPRTCRRKIENSPPPQNGRAGQPQQQHLVKQGTPLSLDGQQQQTQNGQTSGGNGNGIETNGNLNGNGKPQAQKPMVTQAPLADNKGNINTTMNLAKITLSREQSPPSARLHHKPQGVGVHEAEQAVDRARAEFVLEQ